LPEINFATVNRWKHASRCPHCSRVRIVEVVEGPVMEKTDDGHQLIGPRKLIATFDDSCCASGLTDSRFLALALESR